MEFEISRTSMWNDKKPCEEADNGIGWVEMRTEDYFEECNDLLNILQGGDDNE